MNRITPIARVLLGLVFLVFSINYFVPFLPMHAISPEAILGNQRAFCSGVRVFRAAGVLEPRRAAR